MSGRWMWRWLLFLSAVILLTSPSSARAADQVPLRIKAIVIKGNVRVEESTIRFYLTTKVGDPFSVASIQEDIKRLYALGFFKDIKVDSEPFEGGLKLTYIVTENPWVQEIRISGNSAIGTDEILKALAIKVSSVLNESALRESRNKILNLYAQKSRFFASVKQRVIDLPNNQVRIDFVINEGEAVKISKIRFEGIRYFSDYELRDQMQTNEKGFWSFISGSGKYNPDTLRQDRARLEAFYQNRGFLKAVVDEPKLRVDRAAKRVEIDIPIRAGQQYVVGKLTVTGDDIYSSDRLRRALGVHEGDVFSREKLSQGILRITDLYAQKGYAAADVIPTTDVDDAGRRVDVGLSVSRGEKEYIGRIEISGNTKTRDKVIRREITLHEGDVFDSAKLQQSRQLLNRLGYFQSVTIGTERRPDTDLVDLKVHVKERPTGAVSFGAGYSSVDKIIGLVSVSERNLFGTGRQASVSAQLGSKVTEYDLSATDPWFLDRPITAGFDLYSRRDILESYTLDSRGVVLRGGRTYRHYWQVGSEYRFESDRVRDVLDSAAPLIKDLEGTSVTSSITPYVNRDTRDDFFNPTTGWRNLYSVQIAGGPLLGDNDFVKLVADNGRYIPLGKRLILLLRNRLGYVQGYGGKDVPIYERFYLGGTGTDLRGYKRSEVGPKDSSGNPIGGYTEFLLNTEFQIPLQQVVRGVIFFDMGNVYAKNEAFRLNDLRKSVGVGLRLLTPFGPIRIDWGYKLNKRPGETSSQFDFAVGSFF